MYEQTADQRAKALQDANLTSAQKEGVITGTGYNSGKDVINLGSSASYPTPSAPSAVGGPVPGPTYNANDTSGKNSSTTSNPVASDTGYYSRITGEPIPTPITARTEDEIAADKAKQAQSIIDNINKYYDSQVAEQKTVNEGRTRGTNSISVLTGLAGSTEANIAADKTASLNARDIDKINNERAVQIGSILSKIRSEAVDEAKQSRLEARQNAQDILAARKTKQENAVKDLTALASAGTTLAGLKATDPSSYDYLVKTVGGEQLANAYMVMNRPKNDILSTTRVGDHFVQVYRNPITGATVAENIPIPGGLPTEYKSFTKMGDNLVAMPENWDGDVTKLRTIVGKPSESDLLDQAYKRAQTAKIYADMAKDGGGGSGQGKYESDLDALLGRVPNLISSENGKVAFAQSIKRARNDADKIAAAATVILKNSPATVRQDFTNQTIGIKNIDKALAILKEGTKTGVLQNASQYAYNLAGKDFDPKIAAINAYVTAAIQPYRNSVTGAAWGDQEDAEYASLFGNTKYSPKELEERLTRVKEIMKDKSAAALNAQVNPTSDYNPFSTGSAGDPYSSYRSQLSPGEILVNRNGQATAITESELRSTDVRL